MHDRRWVGRNRGKNLKSDFRIRRCGLYVNVKIGKMREKRGKLQIYNVNAGLFSALAIILVCLLFSLRTSAIEPLHAGFLTDHFHLTLDEGERTEIAGPFFYSQERDTENIWAVPPV